MDASEEGEYAIIGDDVWLGELISSRLPTNVAEVLTALPENLRYAVRILHALVSKGPATRMQWKELCLESQIAYNAEVSWWDLRPLSLVKEYGEPLEGRLSFKELSTTLFHLDGGRTLCRTTTYDFPFWSRGEGWLEDIVDKNDVSKPGPLAVWPALHSWLLYSPYDGHSSFVATSSNKCLKNLLLDPMLETIRLR